MKPFRSTTLHCLHVYFHRSLNEKKKHFNFSTGLRVSENISQNSTLFTSDWMTDRDTRLVGGEGSFATRLSVEMDSTEGRGTRHHQRQLRENNRHRVVLFDDEEEEEEEEKESVGGDEGDGEKTRWQLMTDYIVSYCSRSYKGLLVLCMLIFSFSMFYNLIQIFITIFS